MKSLELYPTDPNARAHQAFISVEAAIRGFFTKRNVESFPEASVITYNEREALRCWCWEVRLNDHVVIRVCYKCTKEEHYSRLIHTGWKDMVDSPLNILVDEEIDCGPFTPVGVVDVMHAFINHMTEIRPGCTPATAVIVPAIPPEEDVTITDLEGGVGRVAVILNPWKDWLEEGVYYELYTVISYNARKPTDGN